MSLKNTLVASLVFLAATLNSRAIAQTEATLPQIEIVYPKDSQTVGAVDSTFVFGHLPKGLPEDFDEYVITVNGGETFPVHAAGGWLAFVPVEPGPFVFDIRAFHEDDSLAETARGSVFVLIPEPKETARMDSLEILGDYRPPQGDVVTTEGQMLTVSFRGSPHQTAWFSIPGLVDSVPMAETPPRPQPYWGESVFGAGGIPDSLLLEGVYTGQYKIPAKADSVDTAVVYHLALSDETIGVIRGISGGWFGAEESDSLWFSLRPHDSAYSSYRVAIDPVDFPRTVRFTDSVQIIRHGPRRGYFATFQPEGVEALVAGAEGDWYKLQLSPGQFAWAARESVEELPMGTIPPFSLLRVVRTYNEPDRVRIEFPLSGKHPFRVWQPDRTTVKVSLYGVTSDTDWIRYQVGDSLIDFADWSQPEEGVYELTLHLHKTLWGYDGYYRGSTFCLEMMKPPAGLPSVKDLTIVIDPGHSSDPGSVGPTGLTEAEANLSIAQEVAWLLRRRGANAILTREDTAHVELYDRPAIAVANDADLFLSIHNNALPDGVNPFENYGSSTYYYHTHSIDLAKAVHNRLVPATGLPDWGLYHGNLAVARPTQYPAILIECAFMMIPEQESSLRDDRRFRIDIARAIAAGVDDFLKGYARDN